MDFLGPRGWRHGATDLERTEALLEVPEEGISARSGVLSMLGGDFLFESGEDLSIGYETHDADAVHLYLEESFSFRVATPEAAVELTD